MWGSRVPILEFWYPTNVISQEPLNLETSNLTRRRTAVSSNEKMQNWVKRGHVLVTCPNFGILGPLISRKWLKLETSNLARRRPAESSYEKNAKLCQRGHVGVTCFNFGILVPHQRNISGTVKSRNFKFDTETDGSEL